MSSSFSRLPSSPLSTSSPGSSTPSTPRIVLPQSNQMATHSKPIAMPASSKEPNTLPLRPHQRGHSTSDLAHLPDLTDLATIKVTSTHGTSSSLPSSNAFDESMKSTFRDRSRSPGPRIAADEETEDSDHPLRHSWWDLEKHVARPWRDPPKKKKTVPSEQTEALQSTQRRVAQAVASALGTAADITHEVLYIGVNLLDLAPIPGLKPAAELLLNIWDASQLVDMNRLGCLRLTERCADILISVREEIFAAGDVLAQDLTAPIRKLEDSFQAVYHFLTKQTSRPFLKRYLKRDEILRDISDCDSSLRDALGLFGISIQIRILKQVHETEMRRQTETKALLEAIMTDHPTPDTKITIEDMKTATSNNRQLETLTHVITTENALGLFEDYESLLPSTLPQNLAPSQVIPALTSLQSLQNTLDTARDTADLRQLMQTALQATSDAQMLEVLQIGRREMPDAIKTLQRALEHVTEQDDDRMEAPPEYVVVNEDERSGDPLKRSRTLISTSSSSTTSSGHGSERRRDTLHREFIESGIDTLRRMSRGLQTSLPSWTITKYEIDREEKIGIGFFSDVYKGTWRGQTVAIKVLAESTPRKLFLSEIAIWKTLRHRNVLRLYGASSASGDPPWFFVSTYMKNGSLVEHLKRVELEERPSNLGIAPLSPIRSPRSNLEPGTFPAPWTAVRGISPSRRDLTPPGAKGRISPQEDTIVHRESDLFRFMHEITKGMEYLHSQGVLHGDLKAANVLVDDKYHCAISDFGQSEIKSEAYRTSRIPLPHGTLRWQSPELMAGQSQLTQEVDVWAFSICCVEILTMGRIPWGPLTTDEDVRHFVLKDDSRPQLPSNSRYNTQGLQDILRVCWSTKPDQRPTFSKLVKDLDQLRKTYGQEIVDSPRDPVIDDIHPPITTSPSPDMRPTCLPGYLQNPDILSNDVLLGLDNISPASQQQSSVSSNVLDLEHTASTEGRKMSYNPPPSTSIILAASRSEDHHAIDERSANIRNERRYRLLLTHDYHPSLTLPLWSPSPVELGAVGYLLKPEGRFVTLFNALTPYKAQHLGIRSLPSIHGYGPVVQPDPYRQDKRTVAQKSLDVLAGLLTFGTFSDAESRRYSFPLIGGHRVAYLCAETTDYRYLEKLEAPKKWFQTHVDFIMQKYGSLHNIQKEDLFLVIGTLSAPNHALLVSHSHPWGQAHFSVYKTPKSGKPWGAFTPFTRVPRGHGPSDDSDEPIIPVQGQKVSTHGKSWDTVLVARLRFKPDVLEPTSK